MLYSVFSSSPAALPCLYNSPIGTNGFSLVFRRNFSLNVSSLILGKGLKPSMTGGWEKSNGTGTDGDVFGVCSGAAGAAAAAMLTLDCKTTEELQNYISGYTLPSDFTIKVRMFQTSGMQERSVSGISVPPPGVCIVHIINNKLYSELERQICPKCQCSLKCTALYINNVVPHSFKSKAIPKSHIKT